MEPFFQYRSCELAMGGICRLLSAAHIPAAHISGLYNLGPYQNKLGHATLVKVAVSLPK